MKVFISFFFLLNSVFVLNAQGSWDMKYVSIDSLNVNYIGKEIRLDFKSSQSDTLEKTINIYSLLSKRDTITLNINEKKIKFIENWRLYVDQGIIQDQSLESISDNGKEKIQIKEIVLKSINDLTFTFEISIYNIKCNPSALKESYITKETIVIKKSKIKGFLVDFK